jgi:hypothetical protein
MSGAEVNNRGLRDPLQTNPKFGLPDELDNRNHIGRALEEIRTKKVHGYAFPPRDDAERAEHRLAAILTFLLLIDFVEGTSSPIDPTLEHAVEDMEGYLRLRYRHLRKVNVSIEPYRLSTDQTVSWFDFVLFAACYRANKATSGGRTLLGQRTIQVVIKFVENRLQRHWLENRERIIHEWSTATVIWATGRQHYVEIREHFHALLPCHGERSARHGDQLRVRFESFRDGRAYVRAERRLWIKLGSNPAGSTDAPSEEPIKGWFSPRPVHLSISQNPSGKWNAVAEFTTVGDAVEALNRRSWPREVYVCWFGDQD